MAGIDHGATIKIRRKSIGYKITMKEVGPITGMIGTEIGITHEIIMKETHPIVGIKCETTIKVTIEMKIIYHNIIMKEIDPITERGHIVEIGHEAIVRISDTRGIKEGIEIIMKTSVKMGI